MADSSSAVAVRPPPGAARRPARPLAERPWPFVAAVVAASAIVSLVAVPVLTDAVAAAFACSILTILAVIDIERRLIPNRIVLPATAALLMWQVATAPERFPAHLLGAVVAALALLLPHLVSRSALGMGDVKLALMTGAALGPTALLAVAIAFVLVFPVALVLAARRGLAAARSATIPFAPFLATAAISLLIAPHLLVTG